MDIETYNRREKMLKLREELLSVQEDRMRGSKGYSVDEVTTMMRYAIMDIQDYEKTNAMLKLMSELAKGKKSGEENGWLTQADVRAHFQEKLNEK